VRLRERFGGHDSTRRWGIGEGPGTGRRRLLTLSSKREFERRKSEMREEDIFALKWVRVWTVWCSRGDEKRRRHMA
jgi:hypothetical protein